MATRTYDLIAILVQKKPHARRHHLLARPLDREGGKAELVDAPDSKFVGGRIDPFRSVLTSVVLYCENRPHVPIRPIQYRPVVPSSRPIW